MGKKNPQNRSLLFVLILGTSLSFATVAIIFLVQYLSSGMGRSISSMEDSYKSGNPSEAIAILDQLDPIERGTSTSMLWYGKSWYLRAYEEQQKSRWSEYGKDSSDWFKGVSADNAVHYLKRASEDPETEAEASFYLGLIYIQKGWYDKSERMFQNLFRLEPTHREGILNYAILKSRQWNYDQAASILLRGVEAYPDFAEYPKNLFWIYSQHLNNYEDAVVYGDLYLSNATRGDVSIIRVRSEMTDIFARFPELNSDTFEFAKEEVPIFIPREH